ncbi:MAG TPA: NAD(P)-dependent oxidoreductase [Ignavibacteriaceae bacterium]|nr:NAD(P)-dependent oxidoreductase [Ignavibacteriaceae bacterium]
MRELQNSMNEIKTVAVTGSSGFVGKHLVKALLEENHNVIEIDIDKGYDLSNSEDIKRVPKYDVIVHLAGKSFVPLSFEIPYDFYYYNQLLMLNVLELSRKDKAKVIFFSSYLYGEPEYLPIDEKHPLKPHNPYAQTKLICEKMCEGYSRDFDVPVIVFRPFNIYGPGQNDNFVIPSILKQLNSGKVCLKDPRPKRDYIYISDVVNACLCSLNYCECPFEVFNLGSGSSHSVQDITKLIIELSGRNPIIEYSNIKREGEINNLYSDNSKVFRLLNWRPVVDLREGIKIILKDK